MSTIRVSDSVSLNRATTAPRSRTSPVSGRNSNSPNLIARESQNRSLARAMVAWSGTWIRVLLVLMRRSLRASGASFSNHSSKNGLFGHR